jgi:nucleotide-binding universal stress UspA family protein
VVKTRIVVGVDGSAGSTVAVRWAAAEARLREAELRVLTAYHRQHPGLHSMAGPVRAAAEESAAAAVVHEAVALARSVAPDVEVRGVALPGYAAPVLLHAAERAALLVVGDRGKGGLPGLPFGSVGNQVATHARGSVAVVRGRPGPAGPVVVGVDDGAAGAAAVIGWAFEEAALRGAGLLAVTARAAGRSSADSGEADELDGQLDGWRAKFPEVPVEREVVAGRPDRVLVQRCEQAQLVVVGPRGHGFEGVLLGAVGTRLLQRADCPVLIARS